MHDQYEDITPSEADFIISIYECVLEIFKQGRPVTLIGISRRLNVTTSELSDYLLIITQMLDKIEEEYQVRQEED